MDPDRTKSVSRAGSGVGYGKGQLKIVRRGTAVTPQPVTHSSLSKPAPALARSEQRNVGSLTSSNAVPSERHEIHTPKSPVVRVPEMPPAPTTRIPTSRGNSVSSRSRPPFVTSIRPPSIVNLKEVRSTNSPRDAVEKRASPSVHIPEQDAVQKQRRPSVAGLKRDVATVSRKSSVETIDKRFSRQEEAEKRTSTSPLSQRPAVPEKSLARVSQVEGTEKRTTPSPVKSKNRGEVVEKVMRSIGLKKWISQKTEVPEKRSPWSVGKDRNSSRQVEAEKRVPEVQRQPRPSLDSYFFGRGRSPTLVSSPTSLSPSTSSTALRSPDQPTTPHRPTSSGRRHSISRPTTPAGRCHSISRPTTPAGRRRSISRPTTPTGKTENIRLNFVESPERDSRQPGTTTSPTKRDRSRDSTQLSRTSTSSSAHAEWSMPPTPIYRKYSVPNAYGNFHDSDIFDLLCDMNTVKERFKAPMVDAASIIVRPDIDGDQISPVVGLDQIQESSEMSADVAELIPAQSEQKKDAAIVSSPAHQKLETAVDDLSSAQSGHSVTADAPKSALEIGSSGSTDDDGEIASSVSTECDSDTIVRGLEPSCPIETVVVPTTMSSTPCEMEPVEVPQVGVINLFEENPPIRHTVSRMLATSVPGDHRRFLSMEERLKNVLDTTLTAEQNHRRIFEDILKELTHEFDRAIARRGHRLVTIIDESDKKSCRQGVDARWTWRVQNAPHDPFRHKYTTIGFVITHGDRRNSL